MGVHTKEAAAVAPVDASGGPGVAPAEPPQLHLEEFFCQGSAGP